MAANPLTYTEIEAFSRLTLTELSPWQVGLICRLDDAVLGAAQKAAPRTAADSGQTGPIPVQNVAAIRNLLRGHAAQRAAKSNTPTT